MDGLMTIEEAADFLRMSARHVRRLVAERRVGFCRLGRSVRFTRDDLNEYIEATHVTPITATDVWADLRKAG